MQTDYIIAGQGIAGSMLAWALIKDGKKVVVIDEHDQHIASLAAGALINPVTGKKLSTTWKIEEILPTARKVYRELEQELGVSFFSEKPIHRYFSNPEDRRFFDERKDTMTEYASLLPDAELILEAEYGAIEIRNACQVNGRVLIPAFREYLERNGWLIEEKLEYAQVVLNDNSVAYKGITAEKVIFCEGPGLKQNPWFSYLPMNPAKGEALIIEIQNFPEDRVLLKGIFIEPLGDHQYYIGSTNEWDITDVQPTQAKLEDLTGKVEKLINQPFKVVEHLSALRPNVKNRRPLIGIHAKHPQLAVFNGMGTKGFSLAPWCAAMFTGCLLKGLPIDPEADIKRFG